MDCKLDPTQLDIWSINLSQEHVHKDELALLSQEELTRYQRFYFHEHKRRFLNAHIALRKILSRYLNCSPESLIFDHHAYGKPYLSNAEQLRFNLSHSEEQALVGVGQKYELGVDIEYFSIREYLKLAEQAFSTEEKAFLYDTPPVLLPLRFFTLWSRKEAFIKANGFGLRYPTEQIDLHSLEPSFEVTDPIEKTLWRMKSYQPFPGFSASLCYHPGIQTMNYFDYALI